MWCKICSKEFWANVFAYIIVIAILVAIGHSSLRSWQKDQEMQEYLAQAELRAQELLASGCEFGQELRLQLEQSWLNRPISPFSDKLQIGIILCQIDDELNPPKHLDMDPRHYVGIGKQKEEMYLVLWNRDGKVKIKRKLKA